VLAAWLAVYAREIRFQIADAGSRFRRDNRFLAFNSSVDATAGPRDVYAAMLRLFSASWDRFAVWLLGGRAAAAASASCISGDLAFDAASSSDGSEYS